MNFQKINKKEEEGETRPSKFNLLVVVATVSEL
jgi:hypothetical protein